MSSPADFETAPDEFVDNLGSNADNNVNKDTPAIDVPAVSSKFEERAADVVENTAETKQKKEEDESAGKTVEESSGTGVESAGGVTVHEEETGVDVPEQTLFKGFSFYLNRDASAYDSMNDADQLSRLIEANGGKTLSEQPQVGSDITSVFVVSPYNDTKLPTVTPTYIRACCQNSTLLKIENYLVPFDEFRSVIDTQLHEEHGNVKQGYENEEVFDDPSLQNNDVNAIESKVDASDEQKLKSGNDQVQHSPLGTGVAVNIPNTNTNTGLAPEQQSQADHESKKDAEPLVEMEDQIPSKISDSQLVPGVPQESYQLPHAGVQQQMVRKEGDNAFDSTRTMLARANMPTHNKASFTEAEDEFILDVVRKNPTRRTTHTLYDEISHYVPNHTGNSIRHRFRVYLSKRLEFVYEVDKYGKLIRDDNGNLIKTKILPPSIKKKFTADEDYSLAIGIKKQFYRDLYQIDPDTGVSLITDEDSPTAIAKRNMTMDPNHVPGTEPSFTNYRVNDRRGPIAREFFKQFGESHSTHTENAWRDRFRKFLLAYGIDNYIEYYEGEKNEGNIPEPMKNLTNRVKRPGIPTPGNYNSAAKRARIYGSEKPNQSGTTSAAVTAATSAVAAASGNTAGQLESGHGHYAVPESELLDEDTMNFISSIRNDLNKFDNSIPFEYPQEIAEAIRNDFSNEEAEFDNIDPDSIPFPPEIASIDLFLPQFFRMSSTREFLEKVHEVISRDYEPSQAEKLVQDLCDEAGVRKTFSTSILTALSGDLMVFPRYFLNMFKHNMNPPSNVPGIWTREDDRMLRANKEDGINELTKRHGTGRLEMRRKFVEKDLI